MRILWTLLALAAVLAGCGRTATRLPATPEDAIKQVHALCLKGEYQATAGLFHGGVEMWERDPGLVKYRVDKVCRKGAAAAEHLVIEELEIRGEGATAKTKTYAKPDQTDFPNIVRWEFVKQGSGWLITSAN